MRLLVGLVLASAAQAADVHAADVHAADVHAAHHGVRDGDDIVWSSRYDAVDVPLLDPAALDPSTAAGAALDGGALDAGVLHTSGEVHTRQHGHDGLHPPLAAGSRLQRVTVDGYAYTPAPELHLDRHVDGWMRPDVTLAGRLAADRLGRQGNFPVYVTGDAIAGLDGLPGELRPVESTPVPVLVVIAATFTGLVLALETARRAFARQVRREVRAGYLESLAEREPR